jgi:hypothetical protein
MSFNSKIRKEKYQNLISMEIEVACLIYKLAYGAILSIFSMLFVVDNSIMFFVSHEIN